jgi:hypothetical protein
MDCADRYCFACLKAFASPRGLNKHFSLNGGLEHLRASERERRLHEQVVQRERDDADREIRDRLASVFTHPSISSNDPPQEAASQDEDPDFTVPGDDSPPPDSTEEEVLDLHPPPDSSEEEQPPPDSTENEEDINDDLLQKHSDHRDTLNEGGPLGDSIIKQVELIAILDASNSPLYLYKQITDWSGGKASPEYRNMTRPSVIKHLNTRYNLSGLAPKKITRSLPKSGCKVDIITHDFLECLYSILTDRELMREENLLLFSDAEGGPFGKPPVSPFMEDIHDGTVYRKAFNVHVNVQGRDLLVPIILFIDKTHCDAKGRLTLEPVSMTIGLLKKEVRRLPESWRCLGYVNNFADLPSYKNPADKLFDYHFVLENILQSFKDAQNRDGISWQLTYRQKLYSCVLKIPLLLVLGDTEGHDKLCGKYLNRTKAAKCLCRVCDCPTDQTGNPMHPHSYTLGTNIEALCRTALIDPLAASARKAKETLKNLSYHVIRNAFTGIKWCDEERGINGATCPEILHVIQHGLILYLIAALTGLKKYKKMNSQARSLDYGSRKRKSHSQAQIVENCSKKRKSNELEGQGARKRKINGLDQRRILDVSTDDSELLYNEKCLDDTLGCPESNSNKADPNQSGSDVESECRLEDADDIRGCSEPISDKAAPDLSSSDEEPADKVGDVGDRGGDDDGCDDDSATGKNQTTHNLYNEVEYAIASLSPKESGIGVFTAQMVQKVNSWAVVLGRSLKHQSDDDYRYALFNGGILSLAKKNGHEERCVVLILLLIFCSKQGKDELEKTMGNERMSLFILVHSLMLLFENFYRCPKFERKYINKLKNFIPLFLKFYSMALQRKVGMGMNFVKFHLLLHYANDLLRFGPSLSTDSSPGESLHKFYKDDGDHTQRNGTTFEYEVGCRHHERIVLCRANQDIDTSPGERSSHSVVGCHFRVDRDGMFDAMTTSCPHPAAATWVDVQLMNEVTQYVQTNLLPHSSTGEVLLYGRCHHNGTLFHGRNLVTKATTEMWQDWVNVCWAQWGNLSIPSRIVTFIKINFKGGQCATDPLVEGSSYGLSGVYAIVHAVPQSLYEQPETGTDNSAEDGSSFLAHQSTRLIYKSGLATNSGDRPDLFLVHVDTMFRGPAVAVPYDIEDANGSEWLFVEPRERWHGIFWEWMNELLDQNKQKDGSKQSS